MRFNRLGRQAHGVLGPWLLRPLALAAGLLGSGTAISQAQTNHPTNFEFVRQAASNACVKLSERLRDAPAGEALSVRASREHAGNFMVESALSEVLTQAGRAVRVEPDSTGPLLEFEVVDLGLAYTRVRRRAWLGSKRVEREARARVFARLVDQQQSAIIWSAQVEDTLVDEVPHADLRELDERTDAEYLKATLPQQSWNKFVEPVVVSGIVIGLVALFFSNQDASN